MSITNNKNSKEKWYKIATILMFIAIIALFVNHRHLEKEKIKTCKSETIAFTTRFKKVGKNGKDLRYYFYYNGEKTLGKVDGNDLNSNYLNNFYQVKFNENKPSENYLLIENKIKPDSIILTIAGFKYMKFHKLNLSTNTYEEDWKWE